MKSIVSGVIAIALLTGSSAFAQPGGHRDRQAGNGDHSNDGRHDRSNNRRHVGWGQDRGDNHNWSRGERMGYNDWNNAPRVDYRKYHLRQPPRGYEWRRQNDRFILGAIAGGLVSAIIMSNGR
jgi:Ni/Co efflux regulator RcnB